MKKEAERESDIILELGSCWSQEAATECAKTRSYREFGVYVTRDIFLGNNSR